MIPSDVLVAVLGRVIEAMAFVAVGIHLNISQSLMALSNWTDFANIVR